jgi:hypothetical protein
MLDRSDGLVADELKYLELRADFRRPLSLKLTSEQFPHVASWTFFDQ